MITIKYHLWFRDQGQKVIDSDVHLITGSDIKFHDRIFEIKTQLYELLDNGDVILHYNCFEK